MPEEKRKIPPRDSWLTLAPGAAVHVDERFGKEWAKLTSDCLPVQGAVRAKCFEIEYVLDQVITRTLLTADDDRRDLFDDLFLKGPGASFRNKIEVIRKLQARVQSLQSLLPTDIVDKLTTVRELRNDFAHYPVTFEPVGEPPNQTLRALLVSRRGTFVLEDNFLQKQEATFNHALGSLETAFKALQPEGQGGEGGA